MSIIQGPIKKMKNRPKKDLGNCSCSVHISCFVNYIDFMSLLKSLDSLANIKFILITWVFDSNQTFAFLVPSVAYENSSKSIL